MAAEPTTAASPPGLAHLPVGLFAISMGVGGTAVAWRRASVALGWTEAIAATLAWLALAVFASVAVAYAIKAARHPRAIAAEWTHPVRAAFVATIPISLLVLATAFGPTHETLSAVLWWTGAPLQAVVTVLIMRAWIADARIQPIHVHPAWFIPVVGNLVAPLAGVDHAPVEASWYFFGVGAVYWLGLLPVVLQRLFVQGVMPPRLSPTLAILVAPPAVAALAWVRLGGAWTDPLALALLGVTLFQLLLLAAQANALRRVPFAPSSWAYTFPLAAAASAMLAAFDAGLSAASAWVGVVALAAASVLVLALAVRTLVAVRRGELIQAEG